MRSWQFVAEPRACPWLAFAIATGHCATAAVPWAAGCTPLLAAVLSLACLITLPRALAAVPGRRCRQRGLRRQASGWEVDPGDGRWVPAEVTGATRVLAGLVLCGLELGGRRLQWWIPRASLPAADFRRLKVALRAEAAGGLARIGVQSATGGSRARR